MRRRKIRKTAVNFCGSLIGGSDPIGLSHFYPAVSSLLHRLCFSGSVCGRIIEVTEKTDENGWRGAYIGEEKSPEVNFRINSDDKADASGGRKE